MGGPNVRITVGQITLSKAFAFTEWKITVLSSWIIRVRKPLQSRLRLHARSRRLAFNLARS